MLDMRIEEYDALLRSDFCSFVVRCFGELYPTTALKINGHIEVMASRLSAVLAGDIRRLIINVPPRHLKSLIGSVAFPAWCLGHNPSMQIMCVSYGQDLADKHAQDGRQIMMASWYRRLFPKTRLTSLRPALQELATTAGGFRFASSVGGVLTGRGADLIIIDDAQKPADAVSESLRKAVNDWFDNTLYSRLNDKRRGQIVIIMQRLHEDDLVGHVLQQEDWELVRFPAIAEEHESHAYMLMGEKRYFRRCKGEALHPEREPLETLDRLRSSLGTYNFAGQYQQAPAPAGGGLVRTEWFRRYNANEPPERFDRIFQSWDTANKPSELGSYSVCTTWGVKRKQLYLLHVLRKQLEYPDLKRTVRDQQRLYHARTVLIEDKASGTQLIQDLKSEGFSAVTAYKPTGDKIMRMHAQTGMIENGFVYLPTEAPWLADYVHELAMFPNGRHDDQVDSTAQALDWFKMPMPNSGMFEYYRMMYERQQHPERFRVVLKVPAGVTGARIQTRDGSMSNIGPDRTIEVPLKEAEWYIGRGYQKISEKEVGDE